MKTESYELDFYAWWTALHVFNVGPNGAIFPYSLRSHSVTHSHITHSLNKIHQLSHSHNTLCLSLTLTAIQHSFPQQNSSALTLSHSGSKSTSQVMFYKFVLELCYLFIERSYYNLFKILF